MSSVVILGDTSGQVSIAAPAVAGTNTATLPVATGELSMLGTSGQTWQNLTASRALSTTYTNSTGKPILVQAFCTAATVNAQTTLTINSIVVATHCLAGSTTGGTVYGIVPPGGTYSVAQGGSSAAIQIWTELR